MTEKELRKLKRSDFLQLLLTQGQDMAELQTTLDKTEKELRQLQDTNERLIAKLDEKDELIEKLKGRLDDKDATIAELQQEIEDIKESRRIELGKAGSIAKAALSLNGIFDVAQKAADQYLYNIRLMHDELEAKYPTKKPKQEILKKAPQTVDSADQRENSEQTPQIAPKSKQVPKALKSDSVKRGLTLKPKAEGTMHRTQKIGLFDKFRKSNTR